MVSGSGKIGSIFVGFFAIVILVGWYYFQNVGETQDQPLSTEQVQVNELEFTSVDEKTYRVDMLLGNSSRVGVDDVTNQPYVVLESKVHNAQLQVSIPTDTSYVYKDGSVLRFEPESEEGLSSEDRIDVEVFTKSPEELIEGEPLSLVNEGGAIKINSILYTEPSLNVFTFPIESENLSFHYQPALNEEYGTVDDGIVCTETECIDEDGRAVRTRPEEIVGSYAVYATQTDGSSSGKLFHIYRPKIIDANGNEIWGELSYDSGVLSVEVDRDFLRNAAYPVIVDPVFGYTAIGGSWGYDYTNDLNAGRFVSPADVSTANSISFYVQEYDPGDQFRGVLLDSSCNIIPNGIGEIVPTPYPIGWAESTFATPPDLDPNTEYFIGVMTTVWPDYKYDTVTGHYRIFDTGNNFSSPTNPSDCTDFGDQRLSAYVTYEALNSSGNIHPEDSVVTGPVSGFTNAVNSFEVQSNDPDADNIRYGVDWDMDGISLNFNDSATQGDNGRNVWSDGNFVYVAESENGFHTYDIGLNGELTYVDSYMPGNISANKAYGVWGDGDFVYVAFWGGGLYSFSVDENGYLTYRDSHVQPSSGPYATVPYTDVWGDGNFVYVTGGVDQTLASYSVDTNGNLTFVDSIAPQGSESYSVWGDGNFIYVSNWDNGIQSYSVDSSGNLTFIDSYYRGSFADGVYGYNNYVFLSDNSGVHTLTVDSSGNFNYVSTNNDVFAGGKMWGDQSFIYKAHSGNGIHVYSVDTFGTVRYVTGDSNPWIIGVGSDDQHVYAAGDNGVNVYSINLGVDEWVPSVGNSPSGFTESFDRSWASPGVKEFQVLAEDLYGAVSLYSPHTITVDANEAPNVPYVQGVTEGEINKEYSFKLWRYDPDDDDIRYGVDWDNDDTVDEWLPNSGYVLDATQQTGKRTWPSNGVKTFKVLLEDEHGARSVWQTHSVTIGSVPANPTVQGPISGNINIEQFFSATTTDKGYWSNHFIDVSDIRRDQVAEEIIKVGSTYIIAGTDEQQATAFDAAVWSSTDLKNWTKHVVEAGSGYENIDDIYFDGSSLVAVGRSRSDPVLSNTSNVVVWEASLSDLDTWVRRDVEATSEHEYAFSGAHNSAAGVHVIGGQQSVSGVNRATVWSTSDLSGAWTKHVVGTTSSSIDHVLYDDIQNRYLAVGTDYSGSDEALVVWESADLNAWTRWDVDLSCAFSKTPEDVYLDQATGELVIFGLHDRGGCGGDREPTLWYSENNLADWTRVYLPDTGSGDQWGYALAYNATYGVFRAGGYDENVSRPVMWESVDLQNWDQYYTNITTDLLMWDVADSQYVGVDNVFHWGSDWDMHVGTSSHEDLVRYQVDWDNDSVYEEVSAFASPSDVTSISHTWSSAGAYTFNVRAEDERGTVSGVTSHVIDIVRGPDSPINIQTEGQVNPTNILSNYPLLSAEYEHSNPPTGAGHWDKVDENLPTPPNSCTNDNGTGLCLDESDYVYTSSPSLEFDVYDLEDPAAGQTGTIDLVSVGVRKWGCAALGVVHQGSNYFVDGYSGTPACSWSTLNGNPLYGSDLMSIAKPGGGSWTWTDIANLQLRIGLTANGNPEARIPLAYLEVEYDGGSIVRYFPEADASIGIASVEPNTGGGSGPEAASAYQVQVIRDGGNWNSPLWDSGQVSTSVEEGSRQEVAYGGSARIPYGETYYQRWKFWDSANNAGVWSDGSDFWIMSYDNKTPESPNISGDTTGDVNVEYAFEASSTDSGVWGKRDLEIESGTYGGITFGYDTTNDLYLYALTRPTRSIHYSSDLETWNTHEISPSSDAFFWDIIYVPEKNKYVISGDDNAAVVWESSDLITWTKRVIDTTDINDTRVYKTIYDSVNDQFVSVGTVGGSLSPTTATVWVSNDLINWSRLVLESVQSNIKDIYFNSSSGMYVAVGMKEVGGDRHAYAWESTDLVNWIGRDLGFCGTTECVGGVVFDGTSYVVAGHYGGYGAGAGSVWISNDLINWTRYQFESGASDQEIYDIEYTGSRYLVVGADGFWGGGPAVLWESQDGTEWYKHVIDQISGDSNNIVNVVFDGTSYVVGGSYNNGAGPAYWNNAVWVTDELYDEIRYGFDWNDDSVVDVWVPLDSPLDTYVFSPTQGSASNTWATTGIKNIQVLAEDDTGERSVWSTHTITISGTVTSAPTLSFNATSPILSGTNTTLSWNTTDATSCTASGEWSGAQATSSTGVSYGPLSANTTFTLTCTGPGGEASSTEMVSVNDPACSDGIDNDGDGLFDDGLAGPGDDPDLADYACYDASGNYQPLWNTEYGDPECADGIDNDLDTRTDKQDAGCYSNFNINDSTAYTPWKDNEANTCGVPTTDVTPTCDTDETFGICPSDCDGFRNTEF